MMIFHCKQKWDIFYENFLQNFVIINPFAVSIVVKKTKNFFSHILTTEKTMLLYLYIQNKMRIEK